MTVKLFSPLFHIYILFVNSIVFSNNSNFMIELIHPKIIWVMIPAPSSYKILQLIPLLFSMVIYATLKFLQQSINLLRNHIFDTDTLVHLVCHSFFCYLSQPKPPERFSSKLLMINKSTSKIKIPSTQQTKEIETNLTKYFVTKSLLHFIH